MTLINQNKLEGAVAWAEWMASVDLHVASPAGADTVPGTPGGATVWHLLAQRILSPSAARTRLLEILCRKAIRAFRALRSWLAVSRLPFLPPRLFRGLPTLAPLAILALFAANSPGNSLTDVRASGTTVASVGPGWEYGLWLWCAGRLW